MCYEHYLTTISPCFDPCVLNFQVVFAILQELHSIVEVVQCEQKSFEKMVVNVRFESFFLPDIFLKYVRISTIYNIHKYIIFIIKFIHYDTIKYCE